MLLSVIGTGIGARFAVAEIQTPVWISLHWKRLANLQWIFINRRLVQQAILNVNNDAKASAFVAQVHQVAGTQRIAPSGLRREVCGTWWDQTANISQTKSLREATRALDNCQGWQLTSVSYMECNAPSIRSVIFVIGGCPSSKLNPRRFIGDPGRVSHPACEQENEYA